MRKFPQPFDELRVEEDSLYEIRVIQGETVYGMDRLKDISIDQALFDGAGPQIGGVYSCRCSVKLILETNNWPRAASFEVQARITSADKTQHSDWFSLGTYYTDQRYADDFGNLTLKAYDGMITLGQSWTDKVAEIPSQWPITAKQACDLIQEALGIQFDDRTVLDNKVPFIGLDTTATARDTLAAVAAGMGGNWHVTSEGKLRLILLRNKIYEVTAIAGIAIAGISVVGTGKEDERGLIELGMKVKDIDVGNEIGNIGSVELETSGGTVARAKYGEGYTLKAHCDFSDSNVAYLCMSNINGYSYKPFSATSARLNPAAELGDLIEIAGDYYQLACINWKIGPHIIADISAPFEEVVDHEYPMLSQTAKQLRKAMEYTDNTEERVYSAIRQTEQSISSVVAANYYNNQQINEILGKYSLSKDVKDLIDEARGYTDDKVAASQTAINQTNESISAVIDQINDNSGNISRIISYIYYAILPHPLYPDDSSKNIGTVVVGMKSEDTTQDSTSVRITSDGIYLMYNNIVVSYWDQNEQVSPKALTIPPGGKLTVGNILMQPRSSGNMSFMWVKKYGD